MITEQNTTVGNMKLMKDVLLSFYNMEDILDVKMIGGKIYIFISENEKYVFKFHEPKSVPNRKYLDLLYRHVDSFGFCPRMLRNSNGNALSCHENRLFSVQEYVKDGEDSAAGKLTVPKRLAELHKCLSLLDAGDVRNHLERIVTDMKNSLDFYGYGKYAVLIERATKLLGKYPAQLIHGDLHKENVIYRGEYPLFIDFDSSTLSAAISEVAFSSFRFCKGQQDKMKTFVDVYSASNPPFNVGMEDVWVLVIYNVLQRIAFIHIQADEGDTQWMADLDNQKQYLELALRHIA